ncbi:MAG: LacI family DNA-binding transcriptional regulator [Rubrivivax sp.]
MANPAHERPAPPSVADVARLAGVSPATVSRAFNTPALLGAATLERVQRAAQQLGYQPYGLARSLRRRRSMVVGIVMPSLRYAYYAGTLERLQSLLAQAGYTVLLISANHDAQAELDGVRALMSQGVDGVVLFGRPLHDESAPLLARRGVPHLRCWSSLPDEPSVAFDHEAAMADVVDHLVDLGHRRLAAVIPFKALGDRFRGRLTAIREALAVHGLALQPQAVVDDGGLDAMAGREALRTLRARGVAATAVVCSNDLIAAGVLLEARALGLHVPQDLSVTGYNDSSLARAFEPAITSVDTPVELHAQEVARVLVAALRDGAPIPRVRLPTQLHARASSGPAPRS